MKRFFPNQGFTLAELLIVVAIIAILTAVALPVFGTVLERARESTDLANLRAAYAHASEQMLDGHVTVHTISLSQKNDNWEQQTLNMVSADNQIISRFQNPKAGDIVYVWVDDSGSLWITQNISAVPLELLSAEE